MRTGKPCIQRLSLVPLSIFQDLPPRSSNTIAIIRIAVSRLSKEGEVL
jgi:hypothetical protein